MLNFLKRFIIPFFYNILEIIIITTLSTILYYYSFINYHLFTMIKLIVILISIFIHSFFIGKSALKKGYLEGIKYGSLFILFSLIISIIGNSFQVKYLLYYLIIILLCVIGSIFGIQRKKSD